MPVSFISPPGNDSFRSGRMFCWHLLVIIISFFRRKILKAPSEILHPDQKHVRFYNTGQKFWGTLRKENWGEKRAKFGMISENFKI